MLYLGYRISGKMSYSAFNIDDEFYGGKRDFKEVYRNFVLNLVTKANRFRDVQSCLYTWRSLGEVLKEDSSNESRIFNKLDEIKSLNFSSVTPPYRRGNRLFGTSSYFPVEYKRGMGVDYIRDAESALIFNLQSSCLELYDVNAGDDLDSQLSIPRYCSMNIKSLYFLFKSREDYLYKYIDRFREQEMILKGLLK